MNREEKRKQEFIEFAQHLYANRDSYSRGKIIEDLRDKALSLLTKKPSLTHTEGEEETCNHIDIGTDGGGDFCKICGKRW